MAAPFSLSLSPSFSPPYHVEERESRGGRKQSSHVEQPGGQSSEMTITNRAARWHAMCCWMLMQSTRSTTLVRHLTHLYSSTAFPFPLSLTMRHTTTKKVSAPPCSRASTHAMAAMGRWCGGCGEREQQKRREEEAQHLTHSHMYHLLLVFTGVACRWRRIWAGGGGEERE